MTGDLPPRPTELRDVKYPPQRPPVDGSNEFAAFAAQLAARNEKRRAGEASAAPSPGLDHEEDREEAANPSLSSRLASRPVAAIGGGVLRDLGFFDGPTAGTVGPMTRAAIRKFQLAAGETETGEPSEALFEQLKRKCASSTP
jgi:hypothetical protein